MWITEHLPFWESGTDFSESTQEHMTGVVQQNMLRMDVAMHDVASMSIIQSRGDLGSDPNNFAVSGQLCVADHLGEAGPVDVLQRAEEAVAWCLANFSHPNNIRVVQFGKNLRLMSQSICDHLAKVAATMGDVQTHEHSRS